MSSAAAPLAGVRMVEVSLGLTAVGAGLASSLPGRLFSDLGADVVRVQSRQGSTLDQGVEFARVWDRGKEPSTIQAAGGLDRDRPGDFRPRAEQGRLTGADRQRAAAGPGDGLARGHGQRLRDEAEYSWTSVTARSMHWTDRWDAILSLIEDDAPADRRPSRAAYRVGYDFAIAPCVDQVQAQTLSGQG